MVRIPSIDGGEFAAYLSLPPGGRGPGMVVLQEIFGVNENMRAVCDWYAARGFVAICPDLFWRIEPGLELSEADFDRALQLLGKLDQAKAIDDAAASMAFLRTHSACTGRVGTVGFCLGGRLAYLFAVRQKLDAAVGYYGVGIDNALSEAGKLACPLMLHFAELDKFSSPEAVQQIKKALSSDARVTIYEYPKCDHAFARKGGMHYDAAAAELADSRTIEFFNRTLGKTQVSGAV